MAVRGGALFAVCGAGSQSTSGNAQQIIVASRGRTQCARCRCVGPLLNLSNHWPQSTGACPTATVVKRHAGLTLTPSPPPPLPPPFDVWWHRQPRHAVSARVCAAAEQLSFLCVPSRQRSQGEIRVLALRPRPPALVLDLGDLVP
ncbi:unnamed protein product [Soboliphyme baturini]|uniref:Secreted protein n=1 Tax=Soboliphyme baturini TaxID=241478 RepID=A0A183ISD4_9BILA|nr:unnamed protein product [Soboliphyme baturini]